VASGTSRRRRDQAPDHHAAASESEIDLRFNRVPAWLLGRWPELSIVCASYSAELASKAALDSRSIMNSEWYRRLFPGTRIGRLRDQECDFITTRRGGRFTTSVGGTLTGRGGDVIIIDDPLSPKMRCRT